MDEDIRRVPPVDTRKALEMGRRLEAERLVREASVALTRLGPPYERLGGLFRAIATLVSEGRVPQDVKAMAVKTSQPQGSGARP